MKANIRTSLVLAPIAILVSSASAQTFTTVAPGNWTDGATWSGGVAPDTDVDGADIVIEHDLTVVNNDVKLLNGATFTATNVDFTMLNGNFTVENGDADFAGCHVVIADGFNIQITTTAGDLSMIGCEVEVGQNFQNSEGVRYLEDICLVVNENFQNAKGTDTLIDVCALIGASTSGNFQNDSDSTMHIEGSEFHLPNGDFQNASNADLTGDITAVWLENGNMQNSGTWTAIVANYCVSDQVTVPSGFLPAAQSCATIGAEFFPCDCSDDNIVTYCTGETQPCPCANQLPGQGCENQTGGGGTLEAIAGATSVAADDLVLRTSGLPPGQFGIMFMGIKQDTTALGNGVLCVSPGTLKIFRFPIQQVDASGAYTFGPGIVDHSFNFFEAPIGQILAGDTWNFQTWYRDPLGPCGTGSNLSSALSVTFVP